VVGRQWVAPLERGDGDASNGVIYFDTRALLIEIQRVEDRSRFLEFFRFF
jgi:hypothetical protein